MLIPKNISVYETPTAYHWVDGGIMCSKTKPVERSMEGYTLAMDYYKKKVEARGGVRLCLLADSIHAGKMTKEVREYVDKEITKYFNALAVLSDKPLESSLVNLFLKISWKRFPIRLFTNEIEAREWLKEFILPPASLTQ